MTLTPTIPEVITPRPQVPVELARLRLQWIEVAPEAPYFITEAGRPWTPVGHHEALTWPNLAGLLRVGGARAVERYLRRLTSCGVTCLRLALETVESDFYFESATGHVHPESVRVWDEVIALCEQHGVRLLLSPFDVEGTRQRGTPAYERAFDFARERLAFAAGRWGGSGAIFAWELWRELPGDDLGALVRFITEAGDWLRECELRIHGRAHLQTAALGSPSEADIPATLDFICGQRAVFEARPYFDNVSTVAAYDDEHFRRRQWAHLASGGAGGGLYGPDPSTQCLTPGMHEAQRTLAGFLPLIYWPTFRRRNLNAAIQLNRDDVMACACGDDTQAIVWLAGVGGAAPSASVEVAVPGLEPGEYRVTAWDTVAGGVQREWRVAHSGGALALSVPLAGDLALAIRPAPVRPRPRS